MANGMLNVPFPENEPILQYAPGSPERAELKAAYDELKSQQIEIPVLIGGKEVKTGNLGDCRMPHDHGHLLATYHKAGKAEVQQAIDAALEAHKTWSEMPWQPIAWSWRLLPSSKRCAGKPRCRSTAWPGATPCKRQL